MQWRNIRLIFCREIRDQLRDRRTLFMIAVLPLILYPLLGMSVFQLSQFLRKSEPKVLVIGSEQLAARDDLPPLFLEGRFAADLFDDSAEAARLNLEFIDEEVVGETGLNPAKSDSGTVDQRLKAGDVEVVLRFPPDFGERSEERR